MVFGVTLPILAAGSYILGSATTADALVIKRDVWASPGALGFIYPPPRDYNASVATTRPCGAAFVSSTRQYIPLNGGNIWLLSQTKVENIQLNYADNENPTAQADFTTLGMAMTGLTAGDMCVPLPDFDGMGLTFGDKLTIQIAYAVDGSASNKQYQCADIELVSAHTYEAPAYTCTNTSTIWSDSDSSTTSGASTVTVTASSSGKVSPLAAGWIGACVTLAVAALAFGAAYYVGLVLFGRRNRTAKARASAGNHIEFRGHQSNDDISLQSRNTIDKRPL
ncbi:hypothetical protein L202_08142 [Cryptococcus amylolentus CBS 6039]|uniref:Copper acquisition factor BIM1-like domain-containing protein n=2 Tax=Cryptococcus amylolentus TaxID=104669 RepID=A0A1E3H8S1_9TREE|nr:hypothetical protein L202_08142 [Cryptococcus amylolentus CBS 6039]ODN72703.1 hypothetical protein L202_08142 [Cryptococcus amylolentus CBS 6039]ODN97911.1 hypothetical protein I350_07547 [Cryptococcus amylolentus CBS 6273]